MRHNPLEKILGIKIEHKDMILNRETQLWKSFYQILTHFM